MLSRAEEEHDKQRKIYFEIIRYFRIETMTAHNLSRLSRDDMAACTLVRKTGADVIHKAVVPMWIFYQFMISVVLLRILIVMLTITYKKIYDNMDTQWKYGIMFFLVFYRMHFLGYTNRESDGQIV